MGDAGQPELLLPGRLSEHAASFTPAQIARLGKADLVFMVGGGLERKLGQLSGSEAVNGKVFIELAKAPGVAIHPIREGGGWEKDEPEDEGLPADPHVWLDPGNAGAMAAAAAAALARADPGNAAAYAANATAFKASLESLAGEIEAGLATVKNKPYIVFHDAFQYFERRFDLNAVGSIADFSASAPSARRLREIRGRIAETGAVCAFREPQFDEKFVATVIEGSAARPGILDPLGAELEPGPLAYRQLLRNLAAGLAACLAG
jgi:zinc transport system substrate-binding protein